MSTPKQTAAYRYWTLSELLARAGVRALRGNTAPDVKITSLTDDSRAVRKGSLFVAVRGAGVDGHDFIEGACRAGAVAVLTDRDMPAPQGLIPVVVDDTREALAKLAAAFYDLRNDSRTPLRLIGLTGTNGKTTVAWLLRSILKAAGRPTALIGTIEYDLLSERATARLTTPGALELCRLLAAARHAGAVDGVVEMSSHALDQRRCAGLVLTAGVFTNLSGDHLDYHGTMESYGAAKRRLFDLISDDGVAVVNGDDPRVRALTDGLTVPVIRFGLDVTDTDVTARIAAMDRCASRFVLLGRSFEADVRLPLIGGHNVLNALAAAATAEALGIAPDAIRVGLETVLAVPGRLQRVEPAECPFSVLVDYAHTDAALSNVLDALRPLTRERLICVFGCGGDRDRSKRPRMAAAVGRVADVAYVTSDNPRTEDPQGIMDEILPGFSPSFACRVEVEADRRRAIQAAISGARPGDTVLIAGKGHERYQLVGDKVLPFDDVKVARECLQGWAQSGVADPSLKRERGVCAPVARASGSEDRCAGKACLTPLPSHGDLA